MNPPENPIPEAKEQNTSPGSEHVPGSRREYLSRIQRVVFEFYRRSDVLQDPESIEANIFFERYLEENAEAAETLSTMRDMIREFRERAPLVIVSKCIDGRTHGSKGKGYPPTTITFSRTEGNNVDLRRNNHHYWNRIDRVVSDAERNKRTPALFIALAHRSSKGHGCAAHGMDDAKALAAVEEQARGVRQNYKPDELYVLHGVTNTDDMSERLIFPDGTALDTQRIIDQPGESDPALQEAADIFTDEFLYRPLDDASTARHVENRMPKDLMTGPQALMYRDLRTSIAMESYLLREICRIVQHDGLHNHTIKPHIIRNILDTLGSVRDLPPSLKAPLAYQCIWNIAYTLYQRRRLETMHPEEQKEHLEHAEDIVCYGEGFETLQRNKAILVKTGRGDDEEALTVARKVLLNNREHMHEKPRHPPLVHANIEISGALNNWNAFNDQVLSQVRTMLRAVYQIFSNDVRVLTTYSYKNQKMFYPVHVSLHGGENGDNRISYPADMSGGLAEQTFSEQELNRRESLYAHEALLRQQSIALPRAKDGNGRNDPLP